MPTSVRGGGGDASAPMWRRKQRGEPVQQSPPLPLTPHSLLPYPCTPLQDTTIWRFGGRRGAWRTGFSWESGEASDQWVVVGSGDGRVPKAQYSGGSGHTTLDQTGTSQNEDWPW